MSEYFPEIINIKRLSRFIDGAFDELVVNWGDALELAFLPILKMLWFFENALLWVPWYLIVISISLICYLVSKNIMASLVVGLLMFLIGVLGLWEPAMQSLALMIVSTLMAVILGIPVGIFMARSNLTQHIMLPILDIMQTMPIFVYLIPFVMLFGPGKIPALLATIMFAIPPVIRLTNIGIRQVDKEVIEAYTSFGANSKQLLFNVQIPLSLPTIMAGVNQTTMMALSMVVIASMIGAGGLGYQVLQGIQRLEVSRGLLAGLAIVFLAVIFDKIAQAYGKKMQKQYNLHI